MIAVRIESGIESRRSPWPSRADEQQHDEADQGSSERHFMYDVKMESLTKVDASSRSLI